MARRRRASVTIAIIGAIVSVLTLALPAHAVTASQKLATLSSFTQTNTASYQSWLSARNDQAAWAAYGFDWSTDYCTDGPDNPLGFDFHLSCARHDFGYRNYKAVDLFSANKDRVDSAFYADMKRKCATYARYLRSACNAVAWTYYQAVKVFGSLASTAPGIRQAAQLLPSDERAARQAT